MLTTLMLGLGLLVVIMLVGVNYVVNSFGIMRLMQVKGYDNVYRAWIPFYNSYILGEMVEGEIGDSQLVFPGVTRWIMCLYPLAGAVPALGELAVFVGGIYYIVVLCIFADKYKTTASMVVSSLFTLSGIGMMILASRIESGQPSYSILRVLRVLQLLQLLQTIRSTRKKQKSWTSKLARRRRQAKNLLWQSQSRRRASS